MPTLSPKQLEIRDRESAILETARDIFGSCGYLGLNMNRIAEQMEYAKGTIYQHFKNKEEIILALAIQTLQKRAAMFERAAMFKGKSRHRMAAMGCAAELFVKWFPNHFELEKVLSCGSIIGKTSTELQVKKNSAEMRCVAIVSGIVREGIAAADLHLPQNLTADQLVFGLWAMTYGGYSVMSDMGTMQMMGIKDGFQIVRDNNNQLLDGYGWKSLSSRTDYNAVFEKVKLELFSDGPSKY